MSRHALIAAALTALSATTATAAPTPRGVPVAIACSGAVANEGRAVSKQNDLKLGQDAKACFGRFQIYDGPDHQFVVVAPSPRCPGGKALDVYGQSRAGGWYNYFEKPICGSTLSVGPKSRWGDWLLTIDGRHYEERGAYYVPAP